MDQYNHLVEESQAYLEAKVNLTKLAKSIISNKDLSIEERWNALEYSILKDIYRRYDSCLCRLNELDKYGITFYDDLYIERHQTMSMLDLIERVYENRSTEGYSSKKSLNFDKVDMDALKLEILDSGITHFKYDW